MAWLRILACVFHSAHLYDLSLICMDLNSLSTLLKLARPHEPPKTPSLAHWATSGLDIVSSRSVFRCVCCLFMVYKSVHSVIWYFCFIIYVLLILSVHVSNLFQSFSVSVSLLSCFSFLFMFSILSLVSIVRPFDLPSPRQWVKQLAIIYLAQAGLVWWSCRDWSGESP